MKLPRLHKNYIHLAIICVIGYSLWLDGGKTADWAFLALSVACEVT